MAAGRDESFVFLTLDERTSVAAEIRKTGEWVYLSFSEEREAKDALRHIKDTLKNTPFLSGTNSALRHFILEDIERSLVKKTSENNHAFQLTPSQFGLLKEHSDFTTRLLAAAHDVSQYLRLFQPATTRSAAAGSSSARVATATSTRRTY